MNEKTDVNTAENRVSSEGKPIICMKSISKHFGGVRALKDVDLNLYNNEILGLVGDNAAGKSTLMKILAGVVQPDSGQILMGDKTIHCKSPQDARNHGIEMIYQDFALVRSMWVAGNIFMGRELTRGLLGKWLGILDKKKMIKVSQRILEAQNVSIESCLKPAGALSQAASSNLWQSHALSGLMQRLSSWMNQQRV